MHLAVSGTNALSGTLHARRERFLLGYSTRAGLAKSSSASFVSSLFFIDGLLSSRVPPMAKRVIWICQQCLLMLYIISSGVVSQWRMTFQNSGSKLGLRRACKEKDDGLELVQKVNQARGEASS